MSRFTYPATRREDVHDDYFGTLVHDPYRWLEDADDEAVRAWTEAQAELAFGHLAQLPLTEDLQAQITRLWDYPRYGLTQRQGARTLFTKNDGLQKQAVLYVQDGDAEPRVLLDPNTFSEDGTVALADMRLSHDSQRLLYTTSESGTDWQTIHVLDIDSGQHLPDRIEQTKIPIPAWLPDGSGFYYGRLAHDDANVENNEQNHLQRWFHAIGTAPADDVLIHERPDLPSTILNSYVTRDSRFHILAIYGESATANRLYYRDHQNDHSGAFVPLFDELDASYNFLGHVGETFYVLTTKDAPRGRIIAFERHEPHNWREVLPEGDDNIDTAALVAGHFVVKTLHDARAQINIYDLDGAFLREIDLPTFGTAYPLVDNPDDPVLDIFFTSFLMPPNVYRYDLRDHSLRALFDAVTPFNPDDYAVTQAFATSKDGTRVPMFIVHRADYQPKDKNANAAILWGYGGFNIPMTPQFINWLPAWLDRGHVWAMAVLRGGGEYGEAWHRAAMFENKQNTFDDFISAGEHLIAQGYAHDKRLVIEGGSNGGLLTAACMLQRPDLYGAVISRVPVIDMLRFQKFTAGRYWTREYGNAEQDAPSFQYLYAYSPLHNIQDGATYPPLLIATADHDDRVVPMHAKKFAAALQHANPANTVLLRIDTRAGHGAGKPTDKIIRERVDFLAFVLNELGLT